MAGDFNMCRTERNKASSSRTFIWSVCFHLVIIAVSKVTALKDSTKPVETCTGAASSYPGTSMYTNVFVEDREEYQHLRAVVSESKTKYGVNPTASGST